MNNITWKQIDELKKWRPQRKDFSDRDDYVESLDLHARRAREILESVEEAIGETTLGRQKIALEEYTSDIAEEIYAGMEST